MSSGDLGCVVVAVDSSEESMNALNWAIRNVKLRPNDGHLLILHVQSPPSIATGLNPGAIPFGGPSDFEVPAFNAAIEKHQQRISDAIINHAVEICSKENVNYKTQVVIGDPKEKICQVVEELHADLLVIGCRAFGPIKRIMQLEETTRSGNHDTIQDNPTVLQQILELLRQQTANLTQQQEYQDNPSVLQQILELLRQQTANLTQQQEHQEDHVVTFKTFQYVNPPEFKGYEGPIEAMAWLKEIEKALAIVRVGEAQKTVYASYFLKGEANYWWEYKKALEDAGMITWERFTELFLEKYFPRYMWNQMEIEFLELKQENINVAEYETKFMELARFFPEYVNTDEKMAKRFQQGLKPWIRREVALFELKTYAAVVQKAMIIEGENDWSQDEKYNKKRKSRTQEASQQPRNFRNRYNRRPEFQEGRNENFIGHEIGNVGQGNRLLMVNQQRPQKPLIPECGTCGKKHAGVCNKTNVVCYKCNHRGHYANECQNVKPRVAAACHKCGNVGHYARDCKAPVPGNNMLRVTGPPQLEYEGCCTKLKRGCWMFLGSVSNYCSNHAVSPVMIVKSTS